MHEELQYLRLDIVILFLKLPDRFILFSYQKSESNQKLCMLLHSEHNTS